MNERVERTKKILHVLRNPFGRTRSELSQDRIDAADEIERWEDAYMNLKAWCERNNFDITARGISDSAHEHQKKPIKEMEAK